MYRVKRYHLRRNVKFVIMNSVYYTDKSLQTFYDLKGSEIGREAKPGQDVLKDNDLRARLPEDAFNFAPELRERVRAQIASDCDFLQRMQIMDYSMLIGIHHIPPRDPKSHVVEAGFRIKERQNSARASHGSDPMKHAAASVKDQERNGGLGGKSDTNSVGSHSRTNSLEGDTRKLISDIRETTFGAKNFEFAGLFEEEDDCSFLEGSESQKEHEKAKNTNKLHKTIHDEIELKKEQTVEQIYWPFHRFYDINGFRRMFSRPCFRCIKSPCACDQTMIRVWNIPDFVPPLSDRKDGGIMMDTEGLSMPLTWKGPQGERFYEGKIYYMGIIDVLQQYNARKRVETAYRRLESRGGMEPSCVSPLEYADRFVRFFDEYSAVPRSGPREAGERMEVEASLSTTAGSGEVHVRVSPSGRT
jgi:1-phosphatidylinositol-4-phosphate 5-kinase